MKPFRFHREADAEFLTALTHYAEISQELGNRFYEAVDLVRQAICSHPQRFRIVDMPVRRHLVPDFPYALLYIDEPDRVWIVAAMPLRREPGYWKHRVE